MEQNQNLVEHSSKSNFMSKFLQFFNFRMFRYSLFKQLKAVSSYVLVILMLVITLALLTILFFLKNEGYIEIAKEQVILFKYAFFLVYFTFFTILISFKSVQMVRDEIDDGTLLIFNSMPYTRTRMIIEKWLSVQVVCLIYSTVIILLPLSAGYMIANVVGDTDTILNFKALFSLMDTMFLTSFIIQLLLSTFAILLSLVMSGKSTTGLVSTFGAFAFIGPVLSMILTSIYGQGEQIYSKLNYYQKAIHDSGLEKFMNDPETKDYFKFDNWANTKNNGKFTQSVNEVKNHNFGFAEIFDVKAEKDLMKNNANHFNKNGIKVNTNLLMIKNDVNIWAVDELNKKLDLNQSNPLLLTSFFKQDYSDVSLFKEDYSLGKKLEQIRKIMNSSYFTFDNRSVPIFSGIRLYDLVSNSPANHLLNDDIFKTMIKDGRVGIDVKKEGFTNLRELGFSESENYLYVDNPKYYAFINFIQKLKDIATSFVISTSFNYDQNDKQINDKLAAINKYNKVFKLNNYLNWWSQWYLMWHGDYRSTGSRTSEVFLIPNFTANFTISDKTRSFFKPDNSSGGTTVKPDEEFKEKFITVDQSSIKPIVNMTGLYAAYLSISFILAAVTLYVTIRKDFV